MEDTPLPRDTLAASVAGGSHALLCAILNFSLFSRPDLGHCSSVRAPIHLLLSWPLWVFLILATHQRQRLFWDSRLSSHSLIFAWDSDTW